MYERILVRYGDLTLKGKNKKSFVKKANKLIREKVYNESVKYERHHDRLYILLNGADPDEVIASLKRVSGLLSFSKVSKTTQDLDKIKQVANEIVQSELDDKEVTFKVETKRADKRFPLTSLETSQEVAPYILSRTNLLNVDVHNPELTLDIEIRRNGTYIYCKKIAGMGGFPVGIAGKGLLLLSGGIDSPVAGYLAMKQGVEIDAIHFESTPLTSIESAQKVVDLTKKLSQYAPENTIRLHLVPFKDMHQALLEHVSSRYNITIMRRMMYRIAERIAKDNDCQVLINGDSVGQVASQTLESINSVTEVIKLTALRPLSFYDKQDIIKIASEIDTYDISIRPFADCCTVYVPNNPTTKPKYFMCDKFEQKFDYMSLIESTIKRVNTIEITPDSPIKLALEGVTVKEALNN
ncbi:MAG: tRNA 4-thiouridine(8) synthase ThiI [Candidatus Izimaplasma sp.]|nr:tRNA 4-thiouridine(8) synthase ThiI [Candidatus Izimaplasma bacterium]